MLEITINNHLLSLVEGDITDQAVDAVVNAANSRLILGSGVAGAIRAKGGPAIQRECKSIEYCPTGDAVITGGGELHARFVIHAVGPHVSDPDADTLLASATLASLRMAESHQLNSIAFPAISTGVFGYPFSKCAHIMLGTSMGFMETEISSLREIRFCLYGNDAYSLFEEILSMLA